MVATVMWNQVQECGMGQIKSCYIIFGFHFSQDQRGLGLVKVAKSRGLGCCQCHTMSVLSGVYKKLHRLGR